MTSILYPVADHAGALVWADDLASASRRPPDLRCVGCSSEVILRAGQRNAPHFAHRRAEACTGGETALHRTTIRVLADALASAAATGRAYPIDVACVRCRASRRGDLASADGFAVKIDKVLDKGIRPDLLARTAGKPYFAIEVVVTHAPEDAALALYRALDLPTAVVRPAWNLLPALRRGLTAELMDAGTTVPAVEVLSRCRFPRHQDSGEAACPSCAAPAKQLNVEVSTTTCWKRTCRAVVRVLDCYDCTEDTLALIAASCPDLSAARELAAARGVSLSWRRSQQARGSYLMHLCGSCGAPQGDNFLYGTDECAPSLEPVLHGLLCAQGHWSPCGQAGWPAGSVAQRPIGALGMVGEEPGLFAARRPQASMTVHEGISVNEAVRRMTGFYGR
jgi:hypothetical protein